MSETKTAREKGEKTSESKKEDAKKPATIITDDDEFEEFKAQDMSFNKNVNAETEGEQVWDANWEDEEEESEFVKEVQRILANGGYEQK